MPAKTELKTLQAALEQDTVQASLDDYAVGIFYKENKYSKQAFCQTINLFDRLAETHPAEAKQMIKAILRFDRLGEYLLHDNEPVMMDGFPFTLSDVLINHDIDTSLLKKAAIANNRHNMLVIKPTQTEVHQATEASSASLVRQASDTSTAALPQSIVFLIDDVQNCAKIHGRPTIASDYTTGSLTEACQALLSALEQLFNDAKLTDSSNLTLSNSRVASLHNAIHHWFIVYLIQAPTIQILNQRMDFMMSILTQSTQKDLPHTQELYIVMQSLHRLIMDTELKKHPIIQANQEAFNSVGELLNNPNTIANTLITLKRNIELSSSKLSNSSTVNLEDTAENDTKTGQWINQYFDIPAFSTPAPLKINNSRSITNADRLIKELQPLELLFSTIETSTKKLMIGAFPIYNKDACIEMRLYTLSCALLTEHPRISHLEKSSARSKELELKIDEDKEALDYIKKQIKEIKKSWLPQCRDIPLKRAVTEQCQFLLDQIKLKQSQMTTTAAHQPRRAGFPRFSLFSACTKSREESDDDDTPTAAPNYHPE